MTSLRAIVDESLGWMGPSWHALDDEVQCELKLEGASTTQRGRLVLRGTFSALNTLDVTLDARVQSAVSIELKPHSRGMMTPFREEFVGDFPWRPVGDVEIDRYYAFCGSEAALAHLLPMVHALRTLRRNEGLHEGYLRLQAGRLQIVVAEVPCVPARLSATLGAIGEIWRLLEKGPVDGFVPLDLVATAELVPKSTGAAPRRPVGPSRAPTRPPPSPDGLPAEKSVDDQKADVLALLKDNHGAHSIREEGLHLVAESPLGQWTVSWTQPYEGAYVQNIVLRAVNPHGFRFRISLENFATELWKLFSDTDVEVGNAIFDERFYIRTNQAETMRALAADPMFRARLLAGPFAEFILHEIPRGPTGLDAVEMRFNARWSDEARAVRPALDVIRTVAEFLAPERPPSVAPVYAWLQPRLASLPEAHDHDAKFVRGGARCSYRWREFSASIEMHEADFDTGTVRMEFLGRVRNETEAFEIRPAGHPFFAPAEFPFGTPAQGLPPALTRRMGVYGPARSIDVVSNLVPTVDTLAEVLRHNQFGLRLLDGEVRAMATDVSWDDIDTVATTFLHFWMAMVAVH